MELVRKSLLKAVHKRPRDEEDKSAPVPNYEDSWPHGLNWTSDEAAIRSGILFFRVKFYGTAQLCISHGRRVCEETLLEIKSAGNKMKALLFVSPQGLRLAEEKTRALIFDIEILKLMFSADAVSLADGFTFVTKEADRFYRCYAFASRDSTGFRVASAIAGSYCIGWSSRDDNNNNLIELSTTKGPVPLKPPRDYTWTPSEEAGPKDATDEGAEGATAAQNPSPEKTDAPAKRRTFRQSSLMAFPKLPSLKNLRRQTSLNPEILRHSNKRKQNFDWILTDCNTGEVVNNLPCITEASSLEPGVSSDCVQKKTLLDASLVLNDLLLSPTDLKSQRIPETETSEGPAQSSASIIVAEIQLQSTEENVAKGSSAPPPRPPRPPRLERQAPVADSLCVPQTGTGERPVTPLSPSNPFFDTRVSGQSDCDPWVPLDNSSANKTSRPNAELNEDSQFSDLFDDFNPSMSFDFEDFRVESMLRATPGDDFEATESSRRSRVLCDPFGEEWAAKSRTEISVSSDSNNPFNEP